MAGADAGGGLAGAEDVGAGGLMPLYSYAIPDLERIQKGRGWIYLEVIGSYGQRSYLTLVFQHDKFEEVYRLVGYGWTLPEGDEKPVMWIAVKNWKGKLKPHTSPSR